MDTIENKPQTNQFSKINKEFLQQIESLRETMPLVMILLNANHSKAKKDLIAYIKKHGTEETNDKGEKIIRFSPEDSYNFKVVQKNAEIASTSLEILPNSLFVSLISQYDSFLGKLIREIFNINPQILNSSEKNLTFSKLFELGSIEDARELIIEKEVEAILRESHSAHFEWLEAKLGMNLRIDLPIWQTFIEITERRNLFVHCNGVISNQYLNICNKNNVQVENEIKIGYELKVSPEYFEAAFNCLYEMSTKLTQVVWRKLVPLDLKDADYSLNDICFELIDNKEFNLANILLEFATQTLKKHTNEESKNVFLINQALSLKLCGNSKKSEDIINKKDWSATSNKFKLAKEVLLGNFENACKLMKIIGKTGDVTRLNYKFWPLFSELRQSNLFIKTYEEIFEEKFTLLETPKKLIEQFMIEAEKDVKTKLNLNITSFLQITKEVFPSYHFILYRAENFLKIIFQVKDITKILFESAIKENIDIVKKFNEHLTSVASDNYLNPYTMIRHCLYLSDKILYKNLLFETQIQRLEEWLTKHNTPS